MYSLFFFLLLFLSGCSFVPVYQRPCMEMPCSWRFEYDEGTTIANIRWWEELGDPVLNELILVALANNKDLGVAVCRVFEFRGRLQVAASPLYPQVNVNGTALREKISAIESSTGVSKITNFYSYAFTLAYNLDIWGELHAQADAAYAQALASVENRRSVILNLVGAVAESYIFLRQLDRELYIAMETLEERREYMRLAILRFEGGLTSEIEVTQAVAAFEQTLADVTLLEQQIPQQEDLLSVLLGVNPTSIIRGKEVDDFTLPVAIPAGLPSELLERRPDILQAEYNLIAANANIGAARAAFFPQISLTGLFGGESFQLSNLFTSMARMWQFGVGLLEPIFTGGLLEGELRIAEAQACELAFAYQQTILTAFQQVNDALVAYRQLKELIQVQEARVGAAREYLRLAWLRYYNGQTDYLTVLDAERDLFATQILLTQAQGSLFISVVELYKALGGGWVVDADCCLRGIR